MAGNSFNARERLTVGELTYEVFRLDRVDGAARLPYSLKVLLENLLRNEDGALVTAAGRSDSPRPGPRPHRAGQLRRSRRRTTAGPTRRSRPARRVLVLAASLPLLAAALAATLRSRHDVSARAARPARPASTPPVLVRVTARPGLGLLLVNVDYVAVLGFSARAGSAHQVHLGAPVVPLFGIGVIASRTILGRVPDPGRRRPNPEHRRAGPRHRPRQRRPLLHAAGHRLRARAARPWTGPRSPRARHRALSPLITAPPAAVLRLLRPPRWARRWASSPSGPTRARP